MSGIPASTEFTQAVDRLNYRPRTPKSYHPQIGLIGCGGITEHHLSAYQAAGFNITMLCDIDIEAAKKRADEYFPDAAVVDNPESVFANPKVEVVDIATHTEIRGPLIEAALRAGKHVLSQKPFVLDLDEGLRLVEIAKSCDRQLAVNQNGRFAPHFSLAREMVSSGLLGEVMAAHFSVHWDHSWTKGTKFESMKHLLMYDFAIHWFDMVQCIYAPRKPLRVYASTCRAPGQTIKPHLLGQAVIEYADAQASLQFDAFMLHGRRDTTIVIGSDATFRSEGENHNHQSVTVQQGDESYQPDLKGTWFPDGFHGTMGELLSSIEEGRPSTINAKNNLESLALCFAAIESVESGKVVKPWSVRRLEEI
jgi:predicted dehydrogenase